MNVTEYIEFKAKVLVKELSDNWDIAKCKDLLGTLNDYFSVGEKAKDSLPECPPITKKFLSNYEYSKTASAVAEPNTKRRTKHSILKLGEKKMIIELMLDYIQEGLDKGATKFSFYARDFGINEEYLQKSIMKSFNSSPYKIKRFPNLKFVCKTIPGGAECQIKRR